MGVQTGAISSDDPYAGRERVVTGFFRAPEAPAAARCVWWIRDPDLKEQVSYQIFSGSPTHVRWDPWFTFVEYKLGEALYRADWRPGTEPERIATLPTEEKISDFWYEPGNKLLRLLSIEGCVTTTWMYRDREKSWVVVEKAEAGEWGGKCDCRHTGLPFRGEPRIQLHTLLDSMGIVHHVAEVIGGAKNSGADDRVHVPSRFYADIGFEMDTVFGDTHHALWPITIVDRRSGWRRLLWQTGEVIQGAFEQITFQEEEKLLLVVGKFSGWDARLYDTTTGAESYSFGPHSSRAVWVPAPLP